MKAFLFLFMCVSAFANVTEVAWLRVEAQHSYQDKDVACSGDEGTLYLSLEIDKGKVSFAQIQNYPLIWVYKTIYRSFPLTRAEVDSIEMYSDSLGRSWVKKIVLSEASLRWIVFHGSRTSYCATPQTISKIHPDGKALDFESEGVLEGIYVSRSEHFDITGQRKDGSPFKGTLQLILREYRP